MILEYQGDDGVLSMTMRLLMSFRRFRAVEMVMKMEEVGVVVYLGEC